MSQDRHRLVLNELLDWLTDIEGLAHEVYAATAEALRHDPKVSSFVALLAENEKHHAELMANTRDMAAGWTDVPPLDIRLDVMLREAIETPLRRLQSEVVAGTITQKRAMALIAEVEFAEWNDVFVYIMEKCAEKGRREEMLPAVIQAHERAVEAFMAQLPISVRPELDVTRLARIWETRLLLVDDNRIVRELLTGLLKSVGQVTAAEDGEKALEVTRRHFFDAVVSDISMPRMDGLEFYRQAAAEHPDIKNRFVFISAAPSGALVKYLSDNRLPLLLKPFTGEELLTAVHRITSTAHIVDETAAPGA